MIRSFLTTLIVVTLLPATLFSQNNTNPLDKFMQRDGLESASVAISIKRVSDGATIIEQNPNQSLRLASVTKLFPTWFALESYGEDYKYRSEISYRGDINNGVLNGDLIIEPSGDPTFNSRYFPKRDAIREIISMVKSHKISKIEGQIIVEEAANRNSAKSSREDKTPGSWVWEDISNYYAALPHDLNFMDNSYTIEFQSGAVGTRTEVINTQYKPQNIELINQVVASESNADNAWIYGGPYSNVLFIRGSIPANRASFKIRGATPNPQEIFLEELHRQLTLQGVSITAKSPSKGSRSDIGVVESPSLFEIAKVTNKVSCNLFAESLGILISPDQDWNTSVQSLLRERDIDSQSLHLRDASGLSPQSVASAASVTDLLLYIDKSDSGESFKQTLPIYGKDSHLNRFGTPSLNSKLRAKTGSMDGVQALAGYIESKNGDDLVFCIIVNYYTCSRIQLQESIATLLSEL